MTASRAAWRPLWLLLWWLVSCTTVLAVGPPRFFLEMKRMETGGYWVGAHEVTQGEYEEITGENPSVFRDPAHPVDSVSWDDAEDFCAKLTAREHAAGRLPPEYVYDLPTDAQWAEFSVGADPHDAVMSLKTRRDGTERVAMHAPSPLGLYDVLGNVWEWCRDWYNNGIRKKDSNKDMPYVPSDAEAAANGPEETFKVLRGGAWDTGASDGFTPAARLRYAPGMRNSRTGFRCVVERRADGHAAPGASKTK